MSNHDLNPTANNGLQGSSYLYEHGTSPNTRTAVSQKVRILAPVYGGTNSLLQVGVMASFNLSQSKNVEPVRGIGFGDHIAELVPSVTEPTTADVSRALLYLSNMWQATGYASGVSGPVRSLAHHRWPFDVEQQLVFSTIADNDLTGTNGSAGYNGSGFNAGTRAVQFNQGVTPDAGNHPTDSSHTAIITLLEACWWTQWSSSIEKDTGTILESGNFTITDMHDFSSTYGEFMSTGNDPSIGQLGSVRYGQLLNPAGGGIGGGAANINL